MAINSIEELDVWQQTRELRKEISILAKKLPEAEKYNLTNQIIRSSRSVTANIAEGFGRYHFQENIQFCRQARGSLVETLDHLYCCLDENYIDAEKFEKIKFKIETCLKKLNAYIKYLKTAKNNQ